VQNQTQQQKLGGKTFGWRIQLFGEPATAAPSRYFFPIFSQQK
jgi:hypothetical protein